MPDTTSEASAAAKFIALTALGLLISACVPTITESTPRQPRHALPATYDGAPQSSDGKALGSPTNADINAANVSWRTFFSNPQLRALIEGALANNQELNIQIQEALIAKYEIRAAQGEYLPKAGLDVGAGVERVGEHTSQGRSDEAHGVANPLQDYRVGFTASWEVDIWNKLRNGAKAATQRYLGSVEGRNLVVTKLVAEIARTYYELLALDRKLEVLQRNIEIQSRALEVVKLQKVAARVTELAVQRFAAEVLQYQSRRYAIEQAIIESENRINFLVGRLPQHVPRDARYFDEPLPTTVDVGVPTALLQNRPDVRRAERELAAASLDIEVAKARFYPSLSIQAGVGYEAFNVEHLLATPESLAGNLLGNLTAPLLNRRAIEADYYKANARQVQAVFEYERTLLEAFTDIANQLSLIKNLGLTYDLESRQVDVLTQAIEMSNTLFQSARADYMEVLLTRRDALESQIDLIETKLHRRQALVNVYQALGGGWR